MIPDETRRNEVLPTGLRRTDDSGMKSAPVNQQEALVFTISATYKSDYYEGHGGPDQPQSIEAGVTFPRGTDKSVAEELAAQFPKSAKVRVCSLSTFAEGDFSDTYVVPTIRFRAELTSNGVNGGVNETGLRRYRSFRRTCDKLGIAVEWTTIYTNAYATEAQFEEAVA